MHRHVGVEVVYHHDFGLLPDDLVVGHDSRVMKSGIDRSSDFQFRLADHLVARWSYCRAVRCPESKVG
jgi:hypothetical protein